MKKVIVVILSLTMFACQDTSEDPPEISFDRGPVLIQRQVDDINTFFTASLQIRNIGGGVLELDSVHVDGDSACKFAFEGPDVTELGPNESSFIEIIYTPRNYGIDNIGLEITSNSIEENEDGFTLNPARVAICGQIVADPADAVELVCDYPDESTADCDSYDDPL